MKIDSDAAAFEQMMESRSRLKDKPKETKLDQFVRLTKVDNRQPVYEQPSYIDSFGRSSRFTPSREDLSRLLTKAEYESISKTKADECTDIKPASAGTQLGIPGIIAKENRRKAMARPFSEAVGSAPAGGGRTGKILHGSDMPNELKEIIVVCTEMRDPPPGVNSVYIMGIKTILDGRTAVFLNKTNTRRLKELLESDNPDEAVGCSFKFAKIMANNPQTDSLVPSLQMVSIEARPKKHK